jgi:hypothetical protein
MYNESVISTRLSIEIEANKVMSRQRVYRGMLNEVFAFVILELHVEELSVSLPGRSNRQDRVFGYAGSILCQPVIKESADSVATTR